MSRYARKIDSNQHDIVAAFGKAGCSVVAIQSAQAGCPDLLVGLAGRSHLVEVKPESNVRAVSMPRPEQAAWAARWRGSPVHVVRSATQALELANLLRMVAR